jgi:hypothetical protein
MSVSIPLLHRLNWGRQNLYRMVAKVDMSRLAHSLITQIDDYVQGKNSKLQERTKSYVRVPCS